MALLDLVEYYCYAKLLSACLLNEQCLLFIQVIPMTCTTIMADTCYEYKIYILDSFGTTKVT